MIAREPRTGLRNTALFIAVIGLIFAIYAVGMGVIPGAILSGTSPGPGVQPPSDEARRGREIYIGEGCAYCHTQQVRPLEQDRVFGRPSAPGDFAYATPELLGTERTGPDLSNVGARQSDVWEAIHLYQPRALVADSVMPAYPWLFALKDAAAPSDITVPIPPRFVSRGKIVVETPESRALIAYLRQLKQAPLPAPAAMEQAP
jgi:cytochrome c oxidase cbb3-type subunit 2